MNPLRHYYLYAKHHYERSDDIFKDLKHVHAQWCGLLPQYIEEADVIVKLLELAYVHIKSCSDDYMFISFIRDIQSQEAWKVGSKKKSVANWETDEDYYLRVTRKCLSVLRFTDKDQWPFELGEADPEVLPIRVLRETAK